MLVLGLVEVPWWGLILLTIIAYILYSCRDFKYFSNQGIKGPTPVPIFGTICYGFNKCLPELDLATVKQYADQGVCGQFFGSIPSLLVFDEKLLSEIFVKEFTSFMNRLAFKGDGGTPDKMLANLDDEYWKHVRTEMTPTFTTGKLKKMTAEINRCAKTLADNLHERVMSHKSVEMEEYTGGYAMDAIASTAFGIRVDSQKDRNNAFVVNAKRAFDLAPLNPAMFVRVFFPELASLLTKFGVTMDVFSKEALAFFADISEQTIKMRKSEVDQSQTDFIQLMINKQKKGTATDQGDEDLTNSTDNDSLTPGLTAEEILANAIVFFVAGYDTTTRSLSFLLYNLAVNQDCQNKLVEEIQRVVGDNENVDYSMLQEMPYFDQCINESLRTSPPAVRVNRKVTKDTTINGIFFRKDTIVEIPIYAIHHDPKKWPNPEKFDPERFSAENKKDRSPYIFLPFGSGPRNCIAIRLAMMELKIAAIHLLRKICVTPCEKTKIPMTFAKDSPFLKSDGGTWLKLEPRDKN